MKRQREEKKDHNISSFFLKNLIKNEKNIKNEIYDLTQDNENKDNIIIEEDNILKKYKDIYEEDKIENDNIIINQENELNNKIIEIKEDINIIKDEKNNESKKLYPTLKNIAPLFLSPSARSAAASATTSSTSTSSSASNSSINLLPHSPPFPQKVIPDSSNAFKRLLLGSKLSQKKLRAVFSLELRDGKFFPHFEFINPNSDSKSSATTSSPISSPSSSSSSTSTSSIDTPQSSPVEWKWQEECRLKNFMWSFDGKKNKTIYLTLRCNIPSYSPSSSSFPTSSSNSILTYFNEETEKEQLNQSSPLHSSSSSSSSSHSSTSHTSTSFSSSSDFLPKVSVIKSMIQKGIRRRMTEQVFILSLIFSGLLITPSSFNSPSPIPLQPYPFNLSKLDYDQELLRRIIIISIEDSVLHPSSPIIIWLMMATAKGYKLGKEMRKMLIILSSEIASCPWRDMVYYKNEEEKENSVKERNYNQIFDLTHEEEAEEEDNEEEDETEELEEINQNFLTDPQYNLSPNSITLIASLLIRRSYGGMRGDGEMIATSVRQWTKRLSVTSPNLNKLTEEDTRYYQIYYEGEDNKKKEGFLFHYTHPSYLSSFLYSGSFSRYPADFFNSQSSIDTTKVTHLRWGQQLLAAYHITEEDLEGEDKIKNELNENYNLFFQNFIAFQTNINKAWQNLIKSFPSSSNSIINPSLATLFLTHPERYIIKANHLIIEGVDFHCDWKLLPELVACKKEELNEFFQENKKLFYSLFHSKEDLLLPPIELIERMLKYCVWNFRSGVNFHKYWGLSEEEEEETRQSIIEMMEIKGKTAKLWSKVSTKVNEICSERVRMMLRQKFKRK